MSSEKLGNLLNRIVNEARSFLFNQGELAELTYGAFNIAAESLQSSGKTEVTVNFPVGYRPDKTTISGSRTYRPEELMGRYQYLAFHQLSINGLVQLVTIVEAMLSDVVRVIALRYPHKLGAKRTVELRIVLEASTIEEVHLRATDILLNDLSYKSPAEFADSLEDLLSINLLECPAFHKYMEIK